MHANVHIHSCRSMCVFLCRGVFSQVQCQGICPVTLLLDDRCSVCCCSLIALTEALQWGDSSRPGCSAHKNKESSWTRFTASVNEINKLALLQAASSQGFQLQNESGDLATAPTTGKKDGGRRNLMRLKCPPRPS